MPLDTGPFIEGGVKSLRLRKNVVGNKSVGVQPDTAQRESDLCEVLEIRVFIAILSNQEEGAVAFCGQCHKCKWILPESVIPDQSLRDVREDLVDVVRVRVEV
jgi:hypothetical protein